MAKSYDMYTENGHMEMRTSLDDIWIYMLAPSIGGLLAGIFDLFTVKAKTKMNEKEQNNKDKEITLSVFGV